MSGRLVAWLSQIEHRVINRRDSTSSLVLIELSLPTLLLLWGMQLWALDDEAATALFRADWMAPSLWAQGLLIAWLLAAGTLAWRARASAQPMPWLVQLTVVPVLLAVTLLSLAYGLKDTPMSTVLLAELMFARALFPLWQLRWAFLASLVAVLAAEVYQSTGMLAYAPLLNEPIYVGQALAPWWGVWVRVVFSAAAFPFSWALFFLAATLARHRQALQTLVRTDMLTGLANRREFMTRLEREAHRQARHGRPMSLLMFDVDHFKRVNDTWGHPVGDEVLAQVGLIMRSHTRELVDIAARYGGEEFVLLLPETDLAGAQLVADKIAARLREHVFTANGQYFFVTQSVGIAQVVEGKANLALKVADHNLYEAKQAGRDRIVGSVAFDQALVTS
jgi:diguanylate cyclase (GGDEF)-like protein